MTIVMAIAEEDARDLGFCFPVSQVPMENLDEAVRPVELNLHQKFEDVDAEIDQNLRTSFQTDSLKLQKPASHAWDGEVGNEGVYRNGIFSLSMDSSAESDVNSVSESRKPSILSVSVHSATSVDKKNSNTEENYFQPDSEAVRAELYQNHSCPIPIESLEFLISSPNALSGEVSDRGPDGNENLSLHKELSAQTDELNLGADNGRNASNKSVVVLTMKDDDSHEHNIRGHLLLAIAIDSKSDDTCLCAKDGSSDSAQTVAVSPMTGIDLSDPIPGLSFKFLNSSSNGWSEEVRDGSLDRNEKLTFHDESPIQSNELNLDAEDGRFASNKPVAILTVKDDGISDFHESNGTSGKFSLAIEIDTEPDHASLFAKDGNSDSVGTIPVIPITGIDWGGPVPIESSELLKSCSNAGSEEVSDGVVDRNKKLSPNKVSCIQRNELNLKEEDGRFASNKSVAVLTMMNDSTTDILENNGDATLLCAQHGIYDSAQTVAVFPMTIREKHEPDIGYQCFNMDKEDHVQTTEKVLQNEIFDEKPEDTAEAFTDYDLVMQVPSSRSESDDDSKNESFFMSDHVKETNAIDMVEVKSVSVEPCADRENCQAEKEFEDSKCESLLVDYHVKGNVFDDKLDLGVVEKNSLAASDHRSKVDETAEKTKKADEKSSCNMEFPIQAYLSCLDSVEAVLDDVDAAVTYVLDETNCTIVHRSSDGFSKMPLVVPQEENRLMEETNVRTSEAVSFEVLNVLESSVAESFSGIKHFSVQPDADVPIDNGDEQVAITEEIEGHSEGINIAQSSDLCASNQVEIQAESAIVDEKHSEINMLEQSRPFDECHGLLGEFSSLPRFSSSGVNEPSKTIHSVKMVTDSGSFAHSSLAEVSKLEGNADGVGLVIVKEHTYLDHSFDPEQERPYESNFNIEGQPLEKAESDTGTDISDHISSFFLSDNLFTPFSSRFQQRDGGIECDLSLSTEELLQLSYSEMGKDMGVEQCVRYSDASLDKSPVCDASDNLCINLGRKDEEVDFHTLMSGPVSYELAEMEGSGDLHFTDGQCQTCSLTDFPFEKDGGTPVREYAAMTGELQNDGSISSSCLSGVSGRQREPLEGNNLFADYQMESDSAAVPYWLSSYDDANSQGINADSSDFHMPTEVPKVQSGMANKINTSEKYEANYYIEGTIATAKSDQENIICTDEIVGPEEYLFIQSVDSSVSEPEYESSPLLSPQIQYNSTSSGIDEPQEEACQLTVSRSIGYDFNFRGARKLVDQFDECLAKESEETRKDEIQREELKEDTYSARILPRKQASFQECCGVWDWIRGFRG